MRLNDYNSVLTDDFFEKRKNSTRRDIVDELINEHKFEGYRSTINRVVDKRFDAWKIANTEDSEIEIEDKRVPKEFSKENIDLYYHQREEARKQEYKQESITITIDEEKCIGIALEGDWHLGHEWSYWSLIVENMEKVVKHPNLFTINTGDMLSNESNHPAAMRRFKPRELPLPEQKKMAKWLFEQYGSNMLAFVLGNHDEKSLITEDFDIGEYLANEIGGAYLGFSGDILINLNGIQYNVFLTHTGKGFSIHNPIHGGLRVGKELFDPNVDAVVFGHIHEPTADINVPLGRLGSRIRAIRAATYMRDATYARAAGYIINKTDMDVPVLILHPDKKKTTLIQGIDDAITFIDAQNDKLRNLRK